MKTIDAKSLIVGALLAVLIAAGVAAAYSSSSDRYSIIVWPAENGIYVTVIDSQLQQLRVARWLRRQPSTESTVEEIGTFKYPELTPVDTPPAH